MINIGIVNETTVLNDGDIQPVVNALQKQVTRDFGPVWDVQATLHYVKSSAIPLNPSWWFLVLLDDSDQAGALGYHDLTPNNKPLGKVFVKDDIKYGLKWSVTASHELLEMLGDPYINLTVFSDNPQYLYAYEVCDAVEDDSLAYSIDKVLVSNFVYPSWFETNLNGRSHIQFDQQRKLTRAFQLLSGGYIGAYDLQSQEWTQILADASTKRTVTSRRLGIRKQRHLK